MVVRLGDEISVAILIGDEEVTAVFPGYDNEEMAEAIKKLATGRLSTNRGGVPKDQSFEARVRFFNTMCQRVENVEGPDGPLTPETENWRKLVPANWKVSFAIFFEEKATLTNEDVKN